MKKALQYILSIALAIGLLWYVFNDIDLAELWNKFATAHWGWVAAAAGFTLFSHIVRAARWRLMLQPMGYEPRLLTTSIAVLIGYLVNLALPRAGELARCGSLQRSEQVPFQQSFGAVVAERLLDVVVLALLMGLNLLLEFNRISAFFFEIIGQKIPSGRLLPLLGGGALVLGVIVLLSWKYILPKLKESAVYQRIAKLVGGLWEGFTSVKNVRNPMAFVGLTLVMWAAYYATTYSLCLSLGDTAMLSPLAVLTIVVMGAIGMAAPTVGGIGSYHFLVGRIVMLYGLTQQAGITLATFLHAMAGLLFVVVLGVIAFLASLAIPTQNAATKSHGRL